MFLEISNYLLNYLWTDTIIKIQNMDKGIWLISKIEREESLNLFNSKIISESCF